MFKFQSLLAQFFPIRMEMGLFGKGGGNETASYVFYYFMFCRSCLRQISLRTELSLVLYYLTYQTWIALDSYKFLRETDKFVHPANMCRESTLFIKKKPMYGVPMGHI